MLSTFHITIVQIMSAVFDFHFPHSQFLNNAANIMIWKP